MADKLKVGVVTIEPHAWPWVRVVDRFMLDKIQLTAVWDYDPKLAEKFADEYKIREVVQTPEEMVGKVDAVLVAGGRRPPGENEAWGLKQDDHLELSKPFLKNGIPVMMDKPLADTVEDAVEMIRLAKTNDTLLMSCSANRYAAEIMALKKLVDDGDLGNLLGATCMIGTGLTELKWYLVHIFEAIYVIFGPGIESVFAIPSGEKMVVGDDKLPAGHGMVYRWNDGRLVTVLLLRDETEGSIGTPKRGPRYLWPTDGIVAPYLPLFYYVQVYGDMYMQEVIVKGKGYYRLNLETFFEACRTGERPIPYDHMLEITQALVAADKSAEINELVELTPTSDLMP
jgi:hypothetical protein